MRSQMFKDPTNAIAFELTGLSLCRSNPPERIVAVSYICHDGVAAARSESRATRTGAYQTSGRVADHLARDFSKPLRIGRTKMPTLKDAEFGAEPSDASDAEASGAAALM